MADEELTKIVGDLTEIVGTLAKKMVQVEDQIDTLTQSQQSILETQRSMMGSIERLTSMQMQMAEHFNRSVLSVWTAT